jgi:cytochrome c oxidase subunit 2
LLAHLSAPLFAFLQAAPAGLAEHKITSIFNPLTTPAKTEFNMGMLEFAITGAIFAVVAGLLIYTMIRFRQRRHDDGRQEPPQIYGSNQIEAAWTVIPILIVFVIAGVSARSVWGVEDASPPKNTVHVSVIGHQFWWEVRYPFYNIVTANEIHIPVSHDREHAAYFELQSDDVIHSLWIPELGGKTDLIPNRVNHMWMDPSEAGIFWGSCTEFCGVQHANMLLQVVAEEPEDFAKWVAAQQAPQPTPTEISAGQKRFQIAGCWACHSVKGTHFNGAVGPDLTHLMSRRQIGSGVLENTPANLQAWVVNPQHAKPGCLMPQSKLSDANLNDLVAYLETLK